MTTLNLYDRPAEGSAYRLGLDGLLSGWRRTKVSNGGYHLGSFSIRNRGMPELTDFYNTWLGMKVVENTFGITSYEGIIWQLDLINNGINYRRTLNPKYWHNRVKVRYTDPDGSPAVTAWAKNSDSRSIYGSMDYIYAIGETTDAGATAKRDEALTHYTWPQTRTNGGVSTGGFGPDTSGDGLYVTVAGLGVTMNWTYRASVSLAPASTVIATLVSATDYITTGRIETNATSTLVGISPERRIGDLIQKIVGEGDSSGNIWKGGVYAGGKFIYEQAPTTVDYILQNGALYNAAGTPVNPALINPGFYVRDTSAPKGGQFPGTSNIWDDPQVSYCDEVEFVWPDMLMLKYPGERQSAALPLVMWRDADPFNRNPTWTPYGPGYWSPKKFDVGPDRKPRKGEMDIFRDYDIFRKKRWS